MRLILFLYVFSFVSCVSLKSQVLNEIQAGDSQQKVYEILGEPHSFKPKPSDPSTVVWFYSRRGDQCAVALTQYVVTNKACEDGIHPVLNFFGTLLQGAGQGLQNAPRYERNNCTYDSNGNQFCH